EEIEASVLRLERNGYFAGRRRTAGGELGHDLREILRGRDGNDRVRGGRSGDGANHLDPRPVGGRPAPLATSAPRHARSAAGDLLRQLRDDARLADSGLAADHVEAAVLGCGFVETEKQLRKLTLAADEAPRRHSAGRGAFTQLAVPRRHVVVRLAASPPR